MVDQKSAPRSQGAWAMALTSAAFFMGALDALVVITALPTIHREIGGALSLPRCAPDSPSPARAAGAHPPPPPRPPPGPPPRSPCLPPPLSAPPPAPPS